MVRIAVLVSGGGTNLQALLDAQTAGRIPHGEIALVVSNHAGAYALERAKGAGVPAAVVSKKECGSQAAFEHRLQGILELDGIDMIILAGFMSILSENFTKKWPNRILNIHPSLIPAFCGEGFYGLHVHEAALSRGVKVTGATVHFVNEIPDGGPILCKRLWRSCRRTRRKPCSAGLWNRQSGFSCPRQLNWWPGRLPLPHPTQDNSISGGLSCMICPPS